MSIKKKNKKYDLIIYCYYIIVLSVEEQNNAGRGLIDSIRYFLF